MFVHKNFKKQASKVAHNRPKPFYFTVQPRPQPTAQNWFFVLWNLGTRHLFSYLWLKGRLRHKKSRLQDYKHCILDWPSWLKDRRIGCLKVLVSTKSSRNTLKLYNILYKNLSKGLKKYQKARNSSSTNSFLQCLTDNISESGSRPTPRKDLDKSLLKNNLIYN